MIRKTHANQSNDGVVGSDCQVQLELPIFQVHAEAPARRPSADVIPFRQRSEEVNLASAREDALRRILDFARTLPGK